MLNRVIRVSKVKHYAMVMSMEDLALDVHCCIKCPQNLQVKTLLQRYTAFTCRIHNEILLKVFDPSNRGNLLLKLQFFVM